MQQHHFFDAQLIPNLEIEVHSMFREPIGDQVFLCFSILLEIHLRGNAKVVSTHLETPSQISDHE